MDESDTGMGSVLVLLHTFRVRVFQGFERETVYSRHCRPSCLPRRHCFALLPRLQGHSDLPNGL